MDFTNKELMTIRAALTDSLVVLNMEKEDMEDMADSIEIAIKNYEEYVWDLIEKISIRLGGI